MKCLIDFYDCNLYSEISAEYNVSTQHHLNVSEFKRLNRPAQRRAERNLIISCLRPRKVRTEECWVYFVLFTSYVTGTLGFSREHSSHHNWNSILFQIFSPNTAADAPSLRRERCPLIQDTTAVIFSRVLSIINFKLGAFRQRVMQLVAGSQ